MLRCGLFSVSLRLCMSVGFAMLIMLGFTVSFAMAFVHSFMQHLGFLPGMLAARSHGKNKGGSGERVESSLFHGE